ncbi:hypothetical protein [Mycobacterium sp. PSTR-4-N]|uniref:phage tail termination protein n=1 Tax=Mycobacterium sp. PSTR-4-N TaxID=2917745 RepID=UPI001F14F4C8|nr:hypothetical protein [Mycobacterium sp. PSTR-4-N]MCG7592387.1 hypothetical protein [Mycobacterium sp. PSTR-4-N]
MTIAYPQWWKGGRWDVERLIRDLFMFQDNGAAQGLTGVKVEPWLTRLDDREDWLESGKGLLLVHRMGGHVNKRKQQWSDVSMTQIGAVTQSRDQSNLLMSYVTDVLCEFEEGGDVAREQPHLSGVSTTFMTVPGEVVGPQLIPEQVGDDRLVTTTWEIHADRPRGLPDYRDALGIDW